MTLSEAIRRHGLTQYEKQIVALAKNSIVLRPQQVGTESLRGSSRIGGRPDLPRGLPWPRWNDNPMAFLAQFDCRELAEHDSDGLLPKKGMLYFFYNALQDTWGFDPGDAGSFSVEYWPGPFDGVAEAPKDLSEEAVYKAISVSFTKAVSIPDWESPYVESLRLNDAAQDAYINLLDELSGEQQITKFLGYSNQIQGDMLLECQLVTNGLYCGDPSGYQDPRRKALEPGAKDWTLLFQLDSIDEAGMMWGDVGRLYFYIKNADLILSRFRDSWMIFQCS